MSNNLHSKLMTWNVGIAGCYLLFHSDVKREVTRLKIEMKSIRNVWNQERLRN